MDPYLEIGIHVDPYLSPINAWNSDGVSNQLNSLNSLYKIYNFIIKYINWNLQLPRVPSDYTHLYIFGNRFGWREKNVRL